MGDVDTMKMIVIDVDGTLTDGSVIYDDKGNETKKFSVRDAAGFFAAKEAGIKTMILTGRECEATTKRMKEMKADYVFQNVKNKRLFLERFMKNNELLKDDVGYVGDDLNDYPAMMLCGFIGCPNDSCCEVKEKADYVSGIKGGYGAFRDVMEFYLKKVGKWDGIVDRVYSISGR